MKVTITTADNQTFTVTPDKIAGECGDYPFAVRHALTLVSNLEKGRLDINMPDGRMFRFDTGQQGAIAEMYVRNMAFAKRLAQGGDIGIAEAYLHGDWDTPDLPRFLELFCSNQSVMTKMLEDKPIVRFFQMIRHWLRRNTKSGSRRNIHAHYDLGNRFYEAWLDRTMTYSSALFVDGANDLASAQTSKYRELGDKLKLGADKSVLEIGCGWGGFAEFAGKEYGCHVTGLTISREQHDFAQKRIFEAGLADRVEIRLQDYRDEKGSFDAIASIEMFEAVGEAYWPAYFKQLHDRLKPEGLAGLQVITIDESLFDQYRRELDFIRRYIFPGGMLPTGTIMRQLGDKYGMPLAGERVFGLDYAATLSQWRDRFYAAWPSLTGLGFDERFRRMWEYYLSYCEAGFRAGTIDVRQMVFAKGT